MIEGAESCEIYLDDLDGRPAEPAAQRRAGAVPTASDIHVYILEMIDQLARMAAMAGRDALAKDLRQVADQSKLAA